ncbi:MAG: hypothetical protein KatS3mg114_0023 [Planctomycetaceae bacterium]|nr:MAG: hypothetical protein KatS3mg114_0023 [Planctomycetaceae bacterium]
MTATPYKAWLYGLLAQLAWQRGHPLSAQRALALCWWQTAMLGWDATAEQLYGWLKRVAPQLYVSRFSHGAQALDDPQSLRILQALQRRLPAEMVEHVLWPHLTLETQRLLQAATMDSVDRLAQSIAETFGATLPHD